MAQNGRTSSGIWFGKTISSPSPHDSNALNNRNYRLRCGLHCDAALTVYKTLFLLVSMTVLVMYFVQRDEMAIKSAIEDAESRVLHTTATLRRPGGFSHLIDETVGHRFRWSKLARALPSKDLILNEFQDHYLCGENTDITIEDVATKTLALAVVSYKAPLSLANSMRTWQERGLLDIADEKFIFLNSPSKRDLHISRQYGFRVFTTKEHQGNIMAGPSLAYLVGNSTADYILFLEKDFEMIAYQENMQRELWTGFQHLARGVDVYRLRGKSDWPAEGMPNCCSKSKPPECPYVSEWKHSGGFGDHMNWLTIFCDPDIVANSHGRVVQCTVDPQSYCFTSQDTNWSNNPVLFPRKWFQDKVRDIALNSEKVWEDNRMFEFNLMLAWLEWHPPAKVCVSYQGIFRHKEIDQ